MLLLPAQDEARNAANQHGVCHVGVRRAAIVRQQGLKSSMYTVGSAYVYVVRDAMRER
jgi:hypothetical protein